MSKTRAKKVLPPSNLTREQAEAAFGKFAAASARTAKINAVLDMAIISLREKHQDKLAEDKEVMDENFDLMQAFAIQNREELFTKRKSVDLLHGIIGFRTATPKLATLKGFTWPAVTSLLKTFLPEYVRIKEEADKESLLADRELPEVFKHFRNIGVEVVQDEAFFVEPKKEE